MRHGHDGDSMRRTGVPSGPLRCPTLTQPYQPSAPPAAPTSPMNVSIASVVRDLGMGGIALGILVWPTGSSITRSAR